MEFEIKYPMYLFDNSFLWFMILSDKTHTILIYRYIHNEILQLCTNWRDWLFLQ